MSIESTESAMPPGLALDMGIMPTMEGYSAEPADAISEDGVVETPTVITFEGREVGEFKPPKRTGTMHENGQNLPQSGLIFERRTSWKR